MATGGPRELVGSEHSPQLYVKVPVSTIRNPGITRFIVSITLSDGRVIERKTGTVDMQTQLKDLSTASMNTAEGQRQHELENRILNIFQQSDHLFFDDINTWTWSMASVAHDDKAEHAIDFIRGSADKAPIVAPYAGRVIFNGKDSSKNPTVVVEHSYELNGETKYFYTKYLHMHTSTNPSTLGLVYTLNEKGEEVVTQPGAMLAAGKALGLTGTEGQSEGEHLHEETFMLPDGKRIAPKFVNDIEVFEKRSEFFAYKSIDQRKLFTTGSKAINVQAQALFKSSTGEFVDRGKGKVKVTWNDAVGAWVDTASQLVYDRREQQGGADNGTHWLAFEGEDIGKMVEVLWEKATFIDDKGVLRTDTFTWLRLDNKNKRWNGVSFVSLIP